MNTFLKSKSLVLKLFNISNFIKFNIYWYLLHCRYSGGCWEYNELEVDLVPSISTGYLIMFIYYLLDTIMLIASNI